MKKMKAYVPLTVPLILSILKKSDDLDIAIESRAFGAPVKRTYLKEIKIHLADYIAVTFLASLFIIYVITAFYML